MSTPAIQRQNGAVNQGRIRRALAWWIEARRGYRQERELRVQLSRELRHGPQPHPADYDLLPGDSNVVPMTAMEYAYVAQLCDQPTDDFKRLAVILYRENCPWPKAQAALMLRNAPGAARAILDREAA